MATVQVQVGDVKALAKHAAALAKARARRNAAAAQLIRSIPRELLGMKATLKTLMQAKSPEFFDLYEARERILAEWRERNSELIAELSSAMKSYFEHSEAIAELGSRLKAVLSSTEVTE